MMKQFVWVGGIPRCGTMSCSAFLHLNEQCFMYIVTNGRTPGTMYSPRDFYSDLRRRHNTGQQNKDYFAARFMWSPGEYRGSPVRSAGNRYSEFLSDKSSEWHSERAFSSAVLGIREDAAHVYFRSCKEHADPVMSDDRKDIRLIFLVRKDYERLFYSTYGTGKLHVSQSNVKEASQQFADSILDTYNHVMRLCRAWPEDICVADIVSGSRMDKQRNYERICDFLALEMDARQMYWARVDQPVTNGLGSIIRSMQEKICEHTFHKEYIEHV